VWSLILVKIITKQALFFLLNVLRFFLNSQIIYRHLQPVLLMFSLYWWSETNTHKGPLTSLFSFIKPLHLHCFIRKMLLKNISLLTAVVVFANIYVLYFFILVSVDPRKCSLVWYTLKCGVAHNPMLHSQHLNFVFASLFWQNTHALNSFTFHVCCGFCQVFLADMWMGLVFLVLCSDH
jgi:hypothetical protein